MKWVKCKAMHIIYVLNCRCLTVNPKERPDIVGVVSFIAEEFLLHHESVRQKQISLEKKLEKERKRTQRHFSKANDYMQSYQKLFIASQERYDRLANSQSSVADGQRRCMFDPNNNHLGKKIIYSYSMSILARSSC